MFLGIDLGTSEAKALLLGERNHVVASASAALTVQHPRPLWSEQHPHEWFAAVDSALTRLAHDQPGAMAAVQAIGLAGQMHGAVLLDAHKEVLRQAILWNDGRSADACRALEAAVPDLREISGNQAMPGFTAPKLWWLREHEPEVFARTRWVLLPKDWLRLRLTGECISEMSDASGTLWLDVGRRQWSTRLIAACGLTADQMPRLIEGSAVGGHLEATLAQRWGLRPGLPLAGGGGDNAASAVGVGATRPGEGFVSLGTSGVVFVTGDRFVARPADGVHAFCHALPARWHQMSVMLSAASALRWARELLGLDSEEGLLAQVGQLKPEQRAAAPIFLPYLAGERTPHNDPAATGAWVGLTHAHDAASLGYAVLEGIGFGLLDGWNLLDVTPRPADGLSLVGGGARSAWWAQLLASTLQIPLRVHDGGLAAGALGAARLAWLAAGGREGDVCTPPPVLQRFEPQARETEMLMPRHARFRALYPLLRNGG